MKEGTRGDGRGQRVGVDENWKTVEVLLRPRDGDVIDRPGNLVDDRTPGRRLELDLANVESVVGLDQEVDLASGPTIGFRLTEGTALNDLVFNAKEALNQGLVAAPLQLCTPLAPPLRALVAAAGAWCGDTYALHRIKVHKYCPYSLINL